MELIFRELRVLVSPIVLVEGRSVEVNRNSWNELEIDSNYGFEGRISKRSATKSRFEFFSRKTVSKQNDNWGYVAINDVRRGVDFEIGLEDSVFEDLLQVLGAFGPRRAQIDVSFEISEFVSDVIAGRGAVIESAPKLWVAQSVT